MYISRSIPVALAMLLLPLLVYYYFSMTKMKFRTELEVVDGTTPVCNVTVSRSRAWGKRHVMCHFPGFVWWLSPDTLLWWIRYLWQQDCVFISFEDVVCTFKLSTMKHILPLMDTLIQSCSISTKLLQLYMDCSGFVHSKLVGYNFYKMSKFIQFLKVICRHSATSTKTLRRQLSASSPF